VKTFGFATMLEDARAVAEACEDGTPTIWMGTRVGGSVAACMVASRPARGLIIWDAVHDPVAYFRDILRAQVFSAFRRDEAGTAPKTDLIGDLKASGSIDLLGYRITASLLDELCAEHPLKALDMEGTMALLVDLRRKGDPRSETVRLGAQWEKTGAQVQVMGVALNEPWWYGARSGSKADDTSDPNQTLLDATVGFIEDMARVTP
jgi:pimeloyl-ACP methyl ester carboxylesterase